MLGLTAQLSEAVLGALDLLLRWIVLRVCEGNTQCLLRVLEFASRLLDELYDQARATVRVRCGPQCCNQCTMLSIMTILA